MSANLKGTASSPAQQSLLAARRIQQAAPNAAFCGFALATKEDGSLAKVPHSRAGAGVKEATPLEALYTGSQGLLEALPSPASHWGVVMHRPIFSASQTRVITCVDLDLKRATGPVDIRMERLKQIAIERGIMFERSHSEVGSHVIGLADIDDTLPGKIDLGNGQEIEIFGQRRSPKKSLMLTGNGMSGDASTVFNVRELLNAAGIVDAVINPPEETRQAPVNRPQAAPVTAGGYADWDAVKGEALANLAAWVPALYPTARQYLNGYRVASKDIGRDLEEDIGFQPEGITDFGEEIGRTAIDAVMYAKGVDATQAVNWLASQLGLRLKGRSTMQTAFIGDAPEVQQPQSGAKDVSSIHNPAALDDLQRLETTEPQDLWSSGAHTAFPMGVFPPVIERLAVHMRDQAGLADGFTAMGAMTIAAAALDDAVKIQVRTGDPLWTESARIWTCLYGPPSVAKTPVLNVLASACNEVIESIKRDNAAAYAQWKEENPDRPGRGGKRVDDDRPPDKRWILGDATVEAIGAVLMHNPRGVLLRLDEGGGFLTNGAYSGGAALKELSEKLELFGGGPRIIDRITRGTLEIPNWSASLLASSQPETIRKAMAAMPHAGLPDRFIWVDGSSRHVEGTVDASVVNAFRSAVTGLWGVRGGGLDVVTLSPRAEAVRARYFQRLATLVEHHEIESPRLASHISKFKGVSARLMLVMHAMECLERQVHPTSVQVSEATAIRVERLLWEFVVPHTIRFHENVIGGTVTSPASTEMTRKVAGAILRHKITAITTTDLYRRTRAWRTMSVEQQAAVLHLLTSAGWIHPSRDNLGAPLEIGRGRPSLWRYDVNPAVHDGRFSARVLSMDFLSAVPSATAPAAEQGGDEEW